VIRIAKGLELADDVATQSIAILARRGAGKTYTASVIVEEVIRAKVPVVVLDPTGAWWGLRTSADGEKPGLPVVIFGGDHGDVPLEATAGKVIADVVIEHPGAYVVDLSRSTRRPPRCDSPATSSSACTGRRSARPARSSWSSTRPTSSRPSGPGPSRPARSAPSRRSSAAGGSRASATC
jgi:hypothetical protein